MIFMDNTRKLIGQPDPSEELRILEEKANAVYGEYMEQCNTKDKLLGENMSSAEKKLRELTASLNEISKKVEVGQLNLGNYEASKRKLSAENGDLLRQVQEFENSAILLTKTKVGLVHALDEMKGVADHESKERIALLGKFRNLEHNVDGLKEMLSDEALGKENIAHQLSKALGDVDMWRKKYEMEGLAKSEELEMANLKLQARLSDSQNMIEQLSQKLVQLEKRKGQLQDEETDMSVMLDQAQVLNSTMEKKAKHYDHIVGEWKQKVDGMSMELHIAQNETRNVSAELFKSKNAYEESVLQLDEVQRENKALSIEIKDIMDSITEGGKSIHEIDKICKKIEAEKLELEAALSEAEETLEQEENKVLRASYELTQVKKEIEHRVEEKEVEFASTKKNFAKAVEGMTSALETETKSKVEFP